MNSNHQIRFVDFKPRDGLPEMMQSFVDELHDLLPGPQHKSCSTLRRVKDGFMVSVVCYDGKKNHSAEVFIETKRSSGLHRLWQAAVVDYLIKTVLKQARAQGVDTLTNSKIEFK